MLIHSVTPAHMLTEQPDLPATTVQTAEYGFLEGYETPEGFQMSRLISTDPSLYLREEFAPGFLRK